MSSKKVNKKDKRTTLIVVISLLALIFLITFNIFSIWSQIASIKKEKIIVIKRLQALLEEEEYLKVEVEKLQNPDYVARYAREKYLFSKDGEFNIRIP